MAGDPMPRRVAKRLGIACAHADEIRRDLRGSPAGDETLLDAVLEAVRAGRRVEEPLEALQAALRAAGDARGLAGYTDDEDGLRSLRPPGISEGFAGDEAATEVLYGCPGNGCARYWWPDGPAPVPRCEVSNVALRRNRL
ncbi:hypothetical protein [Streptomyces albus]|uniref:hypothetical protein n=1 Tax=Streptomyces albus TaxID=1888 RepID=UPI0006E14AB5|nr:hypothetical protein [Streptomyces albus]